MKLLAPFAWLLVPLGLWLTVTLFGLPHLVLSYRFYDNGDVYNPRAARTYISCDYLGWHGWRTVVARNGQCPWVRFFPVEGG